PGTINLPGHNFSTGEAVTYTSSGNPISNLSPSGTYYVINVDSNTIQLADSAAHAASGTAIPLSLGTARGTQTLAPAGAPCQGSAVSSTASTINLPNHGFFTGEAVTYSTAGTAITGLTSSVVYYAIVVDASHIKLATSAANAKLNSAKALDPS